MKQTIKNKLLVYLTMGALACSCWVNFAHAETDDECTALWCTGIGWVDDLGDGAWWQAQTDKAGDTLKEEAKDKALEALKAVALQVFPVLAFLGPGESGPSELDIAVEKILNAIDEAETNIIDAIIAESIAQNEADWSALKTDARFYFGNNWSDEEKVILYDILDDLFTNVTLTRMAFQTDRHLNNPNRNFDTYNYDSYHTYLSIVALEIAITTEFTRMTKIIADPNVSNAEIELSVKLVLQGLLNPNIQDTPFYYIANTLDDNWREASDTRFPKEVYYIDHIAYESNHPFAESAGIYTEEVFSNSGQTRFCRTSMLRYWFGYKLEGVEYKPEYWRFFSSPECNIVTGRFGGVLGYTAGLWGDPWGMEVAKNEIEAHKEVNYPIYLERVYDPSREIMDNWWLLAGFEGSRPQLQADNELDYFAGLNDSDGDGLIDALEAEIGTAPDNVDSDLDGMPDGYEYNTLNMNPTFSDDAYYDNDNDGYINIDEYESGSDPNNPGSTPETVKLAAVLVSIVSLILN